MATLAEADDIDHPQRHLADREQQDQRQPVAVDPADRKARRPGGEAGSDQQPEQPEQLENGREQGIGLATIDPDIALAIIQRPQRENPQPFEHQRVQQQCGGGDQRVDAEFARIEQADPDEQRHEIEAAGKTQGGSGDDGIAPAAREGAPLIRIFGQAEASRCRRAGARAAPPAGEHPRASPAATTPIARVAPDGKRL